MGQRIARRKEYLINIVAVSRNRVLLFLWKSLHSMHAVYHGLWVDYQILLAVTIHHNTTTTQIDVLPVQKEHALSKILPGTLLILLLYNYTKYYCQRMTNRSYNDTGNLMSQTERSSTHVVPWMGWGMTCIAHCSAYCIRGNVVSLWRSFCDQYIYTRYGVYNIYLVYIYIYIFAHPIYYLRTSSSLSPSNS